jgi:hypothetical protein
MAHSLASRAAVKVADMCCAARAWFVRIIRNLTYADSARFYQVGRASIAHARVFFRKADVTFSRLSNHDESLAFCV